MKHNIITDFFKKKLPPIDLSLLLTVILLAFFGTIMIFSAGSAYSYARYNDEFYFIKRQLVWVAVGGAVMYLASRIKPVTYKRITPFLYGVTLFLLLLVLIVGFVGNGAKRWI